MTSSRKILILVHTFPPFGTVGGSIRLLKTLRFMERGSNGWSPTIITLNHEIDLLWLGKLSSHSLKDVPQDVKILRTDSGEPKDPSFGGAWSSSLARKLKLLLMLPFRRLVFMPDENRGFKKYLRRAAIEEISKNSYDLVYATSPPFTVLRAAAEIKEKTGVPLVMEIKDDWIAENRFQGFRWHRRFFESRMERRCMAAADKIITVTRKSNEGYKRRYPEHAEKFVCIPNGCDVREYEPYWDLVPEKFEKFTLIHTGVLTGTRDLSFLFSALRRLIDQRRDIEENLEFLIVGKIPASQKKEITRHSLWSHVRNIDYMEREKYVKTLVKSHLPVVVNFTDPALVPGKLYEYWGSRNRILLLDTMDSAAAELVTSYDLGEVVSPSNEDGILRSLCSSFDAWKRGELGRNEVAGLYEFDRKLLTKRLEDTFAEVAGAA